MTGDLVQRLRSLARGEHDDLSIGDEAADRIETLERERDQWFSSHDLRASIDFARNEALEEAARVADRAIIPMCESVAVDIAFAIRALKEKE